MDAFQFVFLTLCLLALGLSFRGPGTTAAMPMTTAVRPRYGTLADARLGKDNLLLLRMIAASLVIYAHSYALSPVKQGRDPITSLFGIYSGNIAVYVFFFISGFLVTGSWQRRQDLRAFLTARLFRVVPAYAACLIGCALLIGPWVSQLDPGQYLRDPLTWSYILGNLTFTEKLQFGLPGVFTGQPRESMNGSLWTLPAEMRAYTLLAVLGALGILSSRWRTALCIGLAAALVLFWNYRIPLVGVGMAKPLIGYFALGVLTWMFRERLPFNPWLALALVAMAAIAKGGAAYPYLFALALSYLSLIFAYRVKSLGFYNRFGDYSYGIYLWGFPMQQLVVYWLGSPTPTRITLLAWPLALICAVLSWRLIEKPSIALGRRFIREPEAAASAATGAASQPAVP